MVDGGGVAELLKVTLALSLFMMLYGGGKDVESTQTAGPWSWSYNAKWWAVDNSTLYHTYQRPARGAQEKGE
eukprot:scaffold6720_cov136-Skeletonema_dohrnii-CCMP3373.AAC.9